MDVRADTPPNAVIPQPLRKPQILLSRHNSSSFSFREDMCLSFRDTRPTCFTLDSTERYAAVVGRRDMVICDLNTGVIERKFNRGAGKWECACAAWSPQRQATPNVIATATNTQLEFFDATHGALKAVVTSGHSRHITDLDWSSEPFRLASSSVDCYIMIYDLRESKPTMALNSITSVSQVKFNHAKPNIIASAHDGQIKLWDLRKTSTTAYHFLTAHTSRIYGIEWSRKDHNLLCSAAQDGMCKVWDVAGDVSDKALLQLHIGLPVWRAKFAPFSVQTITTVVLPSTAAANPRNLDAAVQFWNLEDCKTPVATLVSSNSNTSTTANSVAVDPVIDCAWRNCNAPNTSGAYKFLTFSKQSVLRSYCVDASLQVALGAELNEEDVDNDEDDFVLRHTKKQLMAAEPESRNLSPIPIAGVEQSSASGESGRFAAESVSPDAVKVKTPLTEEITKKLKSLFHPSFDADAIKKVDDRKSEAEQQRLSIDELKQRAAEIAKTAVEQSNATANTSVTLTLLDIVSTVSGGADPNTLSTVLSLQARTAGSLHDVRVRFTFVDPFSRSTNNAAATPPPAINFLKGTSFNQSTRVEFRSQLISRAADEKRRLHSSSATNESDPISLYVCTLANLLAAWTPAAEKRASNLSASFRGSSPSALTGPFSGEWRSNVVHRTLSAAAAAENDLVPQMPLVLNDNENTIFQPTGRFLVRRVDETSDSTFTSRLVLNRNNSIANPTATTIAEPVEYHVKPRLCGLSFTWYGLLAFSDAFSVHSRRAAARFDGVDSGHGGGANLLMEHHGTLNGVDGLKDDDENVGDDDVDGLRSSFAAYFHPGAAAFLKKRHHMNLAGNNRTLHSGNMPKQSNYYNSLRSVGHKFNAKSLRAAGKIFVGRKNSPAEIACVYDLTALLPVQRELSAYRLDIGQQHSAATSNGKNFHAACRYNAFLASNRYSSDFAKKNRSRVGSGIFAGDETNTNELVSFWKLFELCASPTLLHKQRGVNDQCSWTSRHHPLAAKLLQKMLEHFEELGDVQTVATAVTLLPFVPVSPTQPQNSVSKSLIPAPPPAMPHSNTDRGPSPYHTIHAGGVFRFSAAALQQAAAAAAVAAAAGAARLLPNGMTGSGERLHPPPPTTFAADNEVLVRKRSQRSSSWSSLNIVLVNNNSINPQNGGGAIDHAKSENAADGTRPSGVRTLLSPSSLSRFLPAQVEYAMQLYAWLAFVPRREILKTWNFSNGLLVHRVKSLPATNDKLLALPNKRPKIQQQMSENIGANQQHQQGRYVVEQSPGGGATTTGSPFSQKIPFSKKQPKSSPAQQQKATSIGGANFGASSRSSGGNARSFSHASRLQLDTLADESQPKSSDKFPTTATTNDLLNRCDQCGKLGCVGAHCVRCRRFANYCSVCRLPIRGLLMFCAQCGHCGHAQCMREWFLTNAQTTCPRACLCQCVLMSTNVTHNEVKVDSSPADVAMTQISTVPSAQIATNAQSRHHQRSSSPYYHHHYRTTAGGNKNYYPASHFGNSHVNDTAPLLPDGY